MDIPPKHQWTSTILHGVATQNTIHIHHCENLKSNINFVIFSVLLCCLLVLCILFLKWFQRWKHWLSPKKICRLMMKGSHFANFCVFVIGVEVYFLSTDTVILLKSLSSLILERILCTCCFGKFFVIYFVCSYILREMQTHYISSGLAFAFPWVMFWVRIYTSNIL
jgi:hypothetical protein